jgi:transcription elongation GreA/GreB family factor
MDNETEQIKIGEALIGAPQIMEMAEYINHLEQDNAKLLEQLKEAKAYLAATLQQRASAESKVRELQYRLDNKQLINISNKQSIKSAFDTIELINPEQYREKKNQR